MTNYGYDSIRKTVAELRSIPAPRSAMTAAALKQAEARLVEARLDIIEAMPVEDIDQIIECYRNRNGFMQNGTVCVNGKTLLENIQTKAEAKKIKSGVSKGLLAMRKDDF